MTSIDQSLVTVIIPCFNQGQYLAAALDSVQAQTHPTWECIVVNDGSSDCTTAVAEHYSRGDRRIRLVTQENRGLSAARNAGIALARGHYLQFLDADDWIAPDKLERQLKALDGYREPAAAYCYFRFGDPADVTRTTKSRRDRPKLLSGDPFREIAWRWELELTLPAHCFLFDARLFAVSNVRFDEDLPNHEDWDCWLRLFRSNPPLVLVEAHLAIYRLRGGSLSKNTVRMWQGARSVCVKHGRADRANADLFERKRRSLYHAYRVKRSQEIVSNALGSAYDHYRAHTPWPLQRLVNAVVGSVGLLVPLDAKHRITSRRTRTSVGAQHT